MGNLLVQVGVQIERVKIGQDGFFWFECAHSFYCATKVGFSKDALKLILGYLKVTNSVWCLPRAFSMMAVIQF